jgi:hypothetical protein
MLPELPEVPEEPMLPDPLAEFDVPPLAPDVWSDARRSQPAKVMLNAATTSKTLEVLRSDFIIFPFKKVSDALVLDHFTSDKFLTVSHRMRGTGSCERRESQASPRGAGSISSREIATENATCDYIS